MSCSKGLKSSFSGRFFFKHLFLEIRIDFEIYQQRMNLVLALENLKLRVKRQWYEKQLRFSTSSLHPFLGPGIPMETAGEQSSYRAVQTLLSWSSLPTHFGCQRGCSHSILKQLLTAYVGTRNLVALLKLSYSSKWKKGFSWTLR